VFTDKIMRTCWEKDGFFPNFLKMRIFLSKCAKFGENFSFSSLVSANWKAQHKPCYRIIFFIMQYTFLNPIQIYRNWSSWTLIHKPSLHRWTKEIHFLNFHKFCVNVLPQNHFLTTIPISTPIQKKKSYFCHFLALVFSDLVLLPT